MYIVYLSVYYLFNYLSRCLSAFFFHTHKQTHTLICTHAHSHTHTHIYICHIYVSNFFSLWLKIILQGKLRKGTYLSVDLFIFMSVLLSICLAVPTSYLSSCIYTYLYTYRLSICIPILFCLCVCLSFFFLTHAHAHTYTT